MGLLGFGWGGGERVQEEAAAVVQSAPEEGVQAADCVAAGGC